MSDIDMSEVADYVSDNIIRFHESKLRCLKCLNLNTILKKKNPYLFRAKNINIATNLIRDILDAMLSSSEEKLFGDFLEDLAIFIANKTSNGRKASSPGIDLEFEKNNIRYLISIKSGTSWGNSSQQRRQEEDFKTAVKILKQSCHTLNVQPVLGICYGKTKTSFVRGYMKVVGQNFWYLISGNENLYTEIIEPLGYQAKKNNEDFNVKKDALINKFSIEFLNKFCNDCGYIDWKKLVEFNSGNLDLKSNLH